MLDLVKDAGRKKKDPLKQEDFLLWQTWNTGGRKPRDLSPLKKQFKGLIRKESNYWASRADLPPASVHAEFNKQFVNAMKTYDPGKGAAMSTWVRNNLRKAHRWISSYQDPTRIAESRYYNIRQFQSVKSALDDQLGREPTSLEIAERLKWPEVEVQRMEAELRGAIYSGGFGDKDGMGDPTKLTPSREGEVLRLLPYQLSPEQLSVFDYLVGRGGKPKLKSNQIAKRLGLSTSKVSRIKAEIEKQIDEYF